MKASDGLLPQEFADLCGVSKDTLLYYDKIGLFSPELVAENGYRVYSLDQVHTFDLLLLLRDSRLPLKQMKTYLENRNTEEMLSLLRKQSRALKEQIGQLQTLCQRLDFTAQQMERGAQCALDQPAIQQRGEEQYMVVSVASDTLHDRRARMTAVRKFLRLCRGKGLQGDYLRCAVISKEHLLARCYDLNYFCVRTGRFPGPARHDVLLITRPQGQYAVLRHHGAYDSLPQSYDRLMDYIRQEGWTVRGNAYETELIGYICEQEAANYVIEIAIEVGR